MEVWRHSRAATAYTRPDYLARLADEVEWWGVERSGEIVAAWPFVRAVSDSEIGPPPFCYYVGPLFRDKPRDTEYHRAWAQYTDTLTVLVEAVVATYQRFRFSLPIGVDDVRVLQWWNFDHPHQSGFTVTPRYTARIELSAFHDDDALHHSFARTRRRDINPWRTAPPAIAERVPEERLMELYDATLQRSGGGIDPERHRAFRRVIALAESGAGTIMGVVPKGSTHVEAAIIVLDGRDESNGVFCAASPAWRDAGLTAWMLWLGMLRARRIGKRWFDFNGANSPRRAADKHFYGAHAALYFDCSFGQISQAGGRPPLIRPLGGQAPEPS